MRVVKTASALIGVAIASTYGGAPVWAQGASNEAMACTAQKTFSGQELGIADPAQMQMMMSASAIGDKNSKLLRTSGRMNFSRPVDPSLGSASPIFRFVIEYFDAGYGASSEYYQPPLVENIIAALQVKTPELPNEERPVKMLFKTQNSDGSGRVFQMPGKLQKQYGENPLRTAFFNPKFTPLPGKNGDQTIDYLESLSNAIREAEKIEVSFIDEKSGLTIGYSSMPIPLMVVENFNLSPMADQLREQLAARKCPPLVPVSPLWMLGG
ncbi:hypothetical protein ACFOWX_01685 [Sphingorhabdus arenilitoris]|uniref:Uncharacterized protein n=1 Tax=Sphingorhabdus arenilitoris TaxID=1490041 RepID=A0ABV8RCQ6_9SPHN